MNTFDDITTPIDGRIGTALARISTALRSQAWSRALAEGITPTQAEILALLNARGVSLRLSFIAEQLGISAPTASDAVATLVAKGLVDKGKAADDRRAISVSLSPKGKEIAASVNDAGQFFSFALAGMDPKDKSALLALLIKLIKNLQEQGIIPVTRMCVTCKYYQANKESNAEFPHYCNLVKAPFGHEHIRIDCSEHLIRQ